jgi:hypothetical protein
MGSELRICQGVTFEIASTYDCGNRTVFLFTEHPNLCYQAAIMLWPTFMAGIRLVIVLAMALGVLPVLTVVSTPHDPLVLQWSETGQEGDVSGIATADHTHF